MPKPLPWSLSFEFSWLICAVVSCYKSISVLNCTWRSSFQIQRLGISMKPAPQVCISLASCSLLSIAKALQNNGLARTFMWLRWLLPVPCRLRRSYSFLGVSLGACGKLLARPGLTLFSCWLTVLGAVSPDNFDHLRIILPQHFLRAISICVIYDHHHRSKGKEAKAYDWDDTSLKERHLPQPGWIAYCTTEEQ